MSDSLPAAPLGTIADFASHDVPPAGELSALATLSRYQLQSVSRRLLPDYKRLGQCLRQPIPNTSHVLIKARGDLLQARYGNLIRCGSVWVCPVCAATISEYRRHELVSLISVARSKGLAVYLETLTMRHHRWHKVGALLEALREAQRFMAAGRNGSVFFRDRFGFVGSVSALEVTYGAHGWHPHIHNLLLIPHEEDSGAVAHYRRSRWLASLRRVGLDGNEHAYRLDATNGAVADYVSKWGHEPAHTPWGAESELSKAHLKRGRGGSLSPFQILELAQDDGEAASLYLDYANAFKGRNQLRWTPGLRQMIGLDDLSDDMIAAGAGDIEMPLLALLPHDAWRIIKSSDARGELLNVARYGDYDRLSTWLYEGFGISLAS